ncbi:MAG: protein kinase [Deltaproteobacteria bacterium]|nr:protein kinase [Deltaproteobacteria bacterium]MBK8715868.1 protein kinase [Deltaproteobacteria bacterium]MBP7286598.1 protein kinase [Nannocystaceae bacterium]
MNVPTSPCPPEQALIELSQGRADRPEPLREHLDGCDDCRVVVARLLTGASGLPGVVAGRYRVLRLLGRGGMGEVHEAIDTNLERHVAIKTLDARALDRDDPEHRVARLVRESKTMARLRHPNVVAIYDAGLFDGRVFVVMELVDGMTLRRWCALRPRPWTQLLEAFRAAALGLQAAHEQGIVHRDFKPDNVLVDGGGRVQVTDFGLAQADDEHRSGEPVPLSDALLLDDSGSLTQTGTAVGTPAYMAPEQFRGLAIDVRADVFAFCVALYEALAGRRPFEASSARGIVEAQRAGASDEPLRARGIPTWLRAATLAGLACDRDARPPDMAAVLRSLQPPQRRRWWALAAAVTTVAVGVGALGRTRELEACRGREPLAGTWTEAARHELAAPPAVEARIEGWAAAWGSAWTEACAATDPRAGEQRRACLTGQRAAFTALLQRAGELDAVAIERGLPRVALCRDGDLAREMPEPDDAAGREAVALVRDELAEVSGLLLAGQAQELEARGEQLVTQARELGFEPLLAEALAMQAVIEVEAGRPLDGRALLLASAQVASASGHDVYAALAWNELVHVELEHLHDHARGHEYVANARAAIERFATSPAAARARVAIDFAEGMLLWDEGRSTDALARLASAEQGARAHAPDELDGILEGTALVLEDAGEVERALELHTTVTQRRLEALGPDHPQLVMSYVNLASSNFSAGRVELALELTRRAAAIALRSRGELHPDYAMTLHNEGELLRYLGRFEEAIAAEQRARSIFEAVLGGKNLRVASSMMEEAGGMLGLHRYDDAVALMRRALEILDDREQWFEAAAGRANLADALREAGHPELGLADARTAVERLRAGAPERPEFAYAEQVLAEIELELGDLETALPLARAAAADWSHAGFLPYDAALSKFVLARAIDRGGGDPAEVDALLDEVEVAWADAPPVWNERRAALAAFRARR